jgi:hypothetical protein
MRVPLLNFFSFLNFLFSNIYRNIIPSKIFTEIAHATQVKGGKVCAFCTEISCRLLQGLQGANAIFALPKMYFFSFFFILSVPQVILPPFPKAAGSTSVNILAGTIFL